MARWEDVRNTVPDLAGRVEARMNETKHKALATIRKDGSPRLTGVEAQFLEGELWMGMMPGSMKARDILRDPRIALHSATIYEQDRLRDAKISGRAIEVTDQATFDAYRVAIGQEGPGGPESFHLFRVDVSEIAFMSLGGDPPDHMLIETWSEGDSGPRSFKR